MYTDTDTDTDDDRLITIIATAQFLERQWRKNPLDPGFRRTYLALRERVDECYPVTIPAEPPLSDSALVDEDSPEWRSYLDSDFCRWASAFDAIVDTVGYIAARKLVSERQAAGDDLLRPPGPCVMIAPTSHTETARRCG